MFMPGNLSRRQAGVFISLHLDPVAVLVLFVVPSVTSMGKGIPVKSINCMAPPDTTPSNKPNSITPD